MAGLVPGAAGERGWLAAGELGWLAAGECECDWRRRWAKLQEQKIYLGLGPQSKTMFHLGKLNFTKKY